MKCKFDPVPCNVRNNEANILIPAAVRSTAYFFSILITGIAVSKTSDCMDIGLLLSKVLFIHQLMH